MLTEAFEIIGKLFDKIKEFKITQNRIKVTWKIGNKITTYELNEEGIIELLQNYETFK